MFQQPQSLRLPALVSTRCPWCAGVGPPGHDFLILTIDGDRLVLRSLAPLEHFEGSGK